MRKNIARFEKIVSYAMDIMLGFLVLVVLVVMAEAIFSIVTHVVPLQSMEHVEILIEEIATLFILLEIVLMLVRYVRDGHHIPVRYLILISITAILRELLLEHGGGLETIFLSGSILILVVVLFILEKIRSFHGREDDDEGDIEEI